jgi:hypothetical protein
MRLSHDATRFVQSADQEHFEVIDIASRQTVDTFTLGSPGDARAWPCGLAPLCAKWWDPLTNEGGRLTEEALLAGNDGPLPTEGESATSRLWWGSPSRSSSRHATDEN